MAASKELITKIVLRGQVDGSLTKALSTVAKNSETSLNKLTKYGQSIKNAFKTAAVGIGTAAVMAGKAAIDYESAFAGVKKTVDETSTTKYEDLSEGIRNLAKVTPAAATEIAAVAEAAGQLGIKADDVLSFSKVMIDLGESTNLTSDEAATSIAKLFNVTGTSMSQVQNFGSTLVALGNNAATTESDILAMATRIAGSGKQIGLTEQQTLALATSLSSVGIEAEMGGSAISTIMSQIDKSIALNKDSAKIWAKTAGMSAKEFAASWNSDAYGTLQKVLKGMSETKDEGGNLNVLLEELGINSIRQGDTLKRLSSATGLMNEMTDLANKSWSENSALTKEANTRYATMASKLQIAKNKINDAAITVGNKLMPILDQLMDKFDEIDMDAVAQKICDAIQWIIDNFDKIKVGLGILAGAFVAFKVGSFINTVAGATRELGSLLGVLNKSGGAAVSKLPQIGNATKAAGGSISSVNWQTILSVAAAFVALGAGIALASAGIWLIADASAKLAASGGVAIAVMFGLIAALAALAFGASLIGPALTAGAVGFIAFGGAIALVGVGAILAASALAIISAVLPTLTAHGAAGAVAILQLSGALLAFGASAAVAGAGSVVLGAGLVVLGAGLVAGAAGLVVAGAGALVAAVGFGALSLALIPLIDALSGAFTSVLNSIAEVFDSMGNAALNAGIGFSLIVDKIKTLTGMNLLDMGASLAAVATGIKKISSAAEGIGVAGAGMRDLGLALQMISLYAVVASAGLGLLPSHINAIANSAPLLATSLTTAASAINNFASASLMSVGSLSVIATAFKMIVASTANANSSLMKLASAIAILTTMFVAFSATSNTAISKFREGMNKLPIVASQAMVSMTEKIMLGSNKVVNIMQALATKTVNTLQSGARGMHNAGANMIQSLINGMRSKLNSLQATVSRISATARISMAASSVNLPKHGDGGTFTTPHAAVVGDRPETIVPHGNTARNRSLLAEAARGVGAASGGGNVFNFSFAPVINGGNAEENRAMIREEEAKFAEMMNNWIAQNRRLGFDGT